MISTIKDLEKLLKLCRKQGVKEIKLGEIAFSLGDLPHEESVGSIDGAPVSDKYENFPQGELTPEQLMFYSAGGLPENDPENQGELN